MTDFNGPVPPQPEIPQDNQVQNLMARGNRAFEMSVNRSMHYRSSELDALLKALKEVQAAMPNRWQGSEPLRALERALVVWENKHPKERAKRGRLVPALKAQIARRMASFGMQPTVNRHVELMEKDGFEDIEQGEPVNLWAKTHSGLWAASWVASTGISAATNLSGGGTLASVGLGVTLFTVSAATGVGLVVGGVAVMAANSFVQAKAARSSYKHRVALEQIRNSAQGSVANCSGLDCRRCDHHEHHDVLDTVLPYVIAQKKKKSYRRGIGAIPIVSLGETVRSIGKKIKKKVTGTLGQDRENHAHTLAKHYITHDCSLSQRIVAELLSDDEELWLRYQPFPVVKGVLMEKFRSV